MSKKAKIWSWIGILIGIYIGIYFIGIGIYLFSDRLFVAGLIFFLLGLGFIVLMLFFRYLMAKRLGKQSLFGLFLKLFHKKNDALQNSSATALYEVSDGLGTFKISFSGDDLEDIADEDEFEEKRSFSKPKKGKLIKTYPSVYVCIDIETTGLNREQDRIIEVAGAIVSNGHISNRFCEFVRPILPISNSITDLTGITNEMVENARDEQTVISDFLRFCGDHVIVGHNVHFDLDFLCRAAERYGYSFSNDYIDTMFLSRKAFPNEDHHRLSDVVSYLGVSQSAAHRAMLDVETTVQCFSALQQLVKPVNHGPVYIENGYDYSSLHVDISAMHPKVEHIDPDNPFFGKRIVFTGNMLRMGREESLQFVLDHGGTPSDSVTKKTAYLVVGEGGFPPNVIDGKTSKVRKAEEWQSKGSSIQIISETQFFEMIDAYNAENKEPS